MGRRRPAAEGPLDSVDRRAPRHLGRDGAASCERSPPQARSPVTRGAPAAPCDDRKGRRRIASLGHLGPPTSQRTKALHEEYAQSIFKYCLRRLSSREEAEDAAQIVFLNAHRSLGEGVDPEFERAWLSQIAEHVVM